MRYRWIDECKGIGIIAVVVGHVIVKLQHEGIVKIGGVIARDFIYSFHIPFLFTLSGITFSLSYLSDNGIKMDKVRNTIWNNILIYFIWSLLFSGYRFVFSKYTAQKIELVEVLNIPIVAQSSLWYIYILFVAYILVALFYNAKSKRFILYVVMFVACILMPFILEAGLDTYATIFKVGCVFFFLVGVEYRKLSCLGSSKLYIWNKQGSGGKILLLGLLSVFGFIFEYLYFHNKGMLWGGWANVPILGLIQALLFSLFIISLVYALDKKGFDCLPLEYLGKHSLEIYILHMFIFTPLIKLFTKLGLIYGAQIIVISVLTILISLGVAFFFKKLKIWKVLFGPYTFCREMKEIKR